MKKYFIDFVLGAMMFVLGARMIYGFVPGGAELGKIIAGVGAALELINAIIVMNIARLLTIEVIVNFLNKEVED